MAQGRSRMKAAVIGLGLTLGAGGTVFGVGTVLPLPAGAAAGTTLFAAATGIGSGTACSQASPCTLTQALSTAQSGDTIDLVTPGNPNDPTTFYSAGTEGTFNVATSVTIQAFPGLTSSPILDGGSSTRVLNVTGSNVTISGLVVQHASQPGTAGGGLFLSGSGLSIVDSTFSNDAAAAAGAIDLHLGSSATVTGSTFSANQATGGIGGAIANNGTISISASTFASNQAADGGGAIFNSGAGTIPISASTFASNQSTNGGNDLGEASGSNFQVVADIFAGGCSLPQAPLDQGFNVDVGSGCTATGITTDVQNDTGLASTTTPQLGTLGDNGGPTQTIPLLNGNPAIGLIPNGTTVGTAPNTTTLCSATDQRGFTTPAVGPCAAGAFQPIGFAAPTAQGTGTCITPTNACTLATALSSVGPGEAVELTTPGPAVYAAPAGGFLLATANTTAALPVTVAAQPGIAGTPLLDGGTNMTLVLTVGNPSNNALTVANLSGVAIQNGHGTNAGGGIFNQGNLTVSGSSFSKNSDMVGGGAIDNNNNSTLTVTDSTFSGNTAALDGAIFSGGTLSVTGSTFSGNTATNGAGGAIGSPDGTATITDSTFSANTAVNGGALANNSTLSVTDSTFSGNNGDGNANGGTGGAIFNASGVTGATLTVLSSTFVGNRASAGNDLAQASGTQSIAGSVFADTNACSTLGTGNDLGFNVGADGSCLVTGTSGDQTDANLAAELGPLANHGGPTQTIALSAGTTPFDLIPNGQTVATTPNATLLCPTTDQRGVTTSSGASCDGGAAQFATQTVTFTSTAPANAVVNGPTYTPAATASSGLPVTISIAPASASVCTLTGGTASFTGAGTCTVVANQAGNAMVLAAAPQATQSFAVGKGSQTVTFTSTAPANAVVNGPTYTPAATATSGLAVTISIAPASGSVCRIAAGVVSFTGAGTCTVVANQAGNAMVLAAQATQAFTVLPSAHSAGAFLASTPDGKGFWIANSAGAVTRFGDALFYKDVPSEHIVLNQPIVGIAATPDGKGYWLVASDGGIFTFGDAKLFGTPLPLSRPHLNQPIVGMTATPDGKGYYLVATDGGIFTFGDAHFKGSTGNITLNQPIFGMTATPDNLGYYLVAKDGGVFTFGDAHIHGSAANDHLSTPVIGIAVNPANTGYFLLEANGQVFAFGAAVTHGELRAPENAIGLVEAPDGLGYTVVNGAGGKSVFGG